LAPLCFAQFAQRSSVRGTVSDVTGAVVADAKVDLIDTDRNQMMTTQTNGEGIYEFTELNFGIYKVQVQHPGFSTAISGSLVVNSQSGVRYDVVLNVGEATEKITVTSAQSVLETENASLTQNISELQVENLPLNGRNFTSLAAVLPAVSTSPRPNTNPGGTYDVGATFSMGGTQYIAGGVVQGSRDNGFYINGANANENYQGSISYQPSADSIGEVNVGVTDFSAASGRDLTTFNVYTKSGTNTFHGSLYDYLENDALNAQNPYTKEQALSSGLEPIKPYLRRNQFGGNLGGPIYIPKLLNLKDKAFFFVNYEYFPERDGGGQQFAVVPSDAERTGDFSQLLAQGIQLFNPYTSVNNPDGTYTRQPIPGNRLDLAGLVDPQSAALVALWPHANSTPSATNPNNYVYTSQLGFNSYHLDMRFDYKLLQNNNIFVTFSKYHGTNNNHGGVFPEFISDVDDKSYLVTVNDAHVFNPRLTNEFIFAIGDGALQTVTPAQFSYLNSDANPFNKIFQNTGEGTTHGVLGVNVYGYASPGFDEAFRAENQTLQFSDNVNWLHGKHSFSFGGDYFRKGEYDWDFIRWVNFGLDAYPGLGVVPTYTSSGSDLGNVGGDAFADVLLGVPYSMQQRYNYGQGNDALAPELNVVFPSFGLYANDKIKLSSKFTLTLGLRYDLNIPIFARNNLCCALYRSDASGGTLALPGIAPGLSQKYLSADKTNFAPRVSFAYQFTPRTIVRAGYGIFYDSGSSQVSGALGNALNATPGYFTGDQITNSTGLPTLNLSNVFPPSPPLAVGQYPVSTGPGQGYFGDGIFQTIYYYDQKSIATPYYQRYLLAVQREIDANVSITFSYIGGQGRKSPYYQNINVPPYQTGWASIDAFNAARPNNAGRFGDIFVQRPGLNSNYNAGVVEVQRRFARGLQFSASYTLSKTMSDYGLTGQGTVIGYNYPYSIIPNYGESSLSHRNRFVFSGVWQPTYGQNWPSALKVVATGWNFSTIVTLESGDALTPINNQSTPNDFADTVNSGNRLLLVGNPNVIPPPQYNRTFTNYFNTAAFAVPPNNVQGNAGPGIIRGPGQNNWDISLAKTFKLKDPLNLEFRSDFFNAFNHTQWNAVSVTYPFDPNTNIPFGQIEGARDGRIIQLALKLIF